MRRLVLFLSIGFFFNACSHSCKDYHSLAGISNPFVSDIHDFTCQIQFDFEDPLCSALQSARLFVQHGNHAGETGILYKGEFGDFPNKEFIIENTDVDNLSYGYSSITSLYSFNEIPSSGYAQASGLANITFMKSFFAGSVYAVNYKNLTVSFGFYKPSSTSLNLPVISCLVVGDTIPVNYSSGLNSNSPAGWYYIKADLPPSMNQRSFTVRLTDPSTEWIKIDDFMISGTSVNGHDLWDAREMQIYRPFKDHMTIPVSALHNGYSYQYYFETTNDLGVFQSEHFYFEAK